MSKRRGFFIAAGDPGTQKSTSVQMAAQRSWTVKTGVDVLHYYETQVLPRHPELVMPVKITLLDEYGINGKTNFDAQGRPQKINIRRTFENMIDRAMMDGAKAMQEGVPPPYDHFVVDEAGELWDWAFEELRAECLSSSGNSDTRKAYGEIGSWTTKIGDKLKRLKAVGIGVFLVAHSKDAEPSEGKKARASFPSQTVSSKLTAKADGLLMRRVEDRDDEDDPLAPAKAHYFWEVKSSQHEMAKLRGLRPEDADRVRELTLPEILQLAGWDV